MTQTLRGFLYTSDVGLIVGDTIEISLFLQNACAAAGIDPEIENLAELISVLDEQIKARFSPELVVKALDTDTLTDADKYSEEVYIVLSAIEDITVH